MFVTLAGQKIFFDVVGSQLALDGPRMRERPTLLVLHGGPGFDHSTLRVDFDDFADLAQVIYLDHRGNGRSLPSDPATWTLAQWGDDIRAFCDVLGIDKPIVFGQSFGGMVAQAYAAQHPDHPRAVVFSSTAARMDLDLSIKLLTASGGTEAGVVAERFFAHGAEADLAEYARVCMPHYNTTSRPDAALMGKRAIMRIDVWRKFFLPGGEVRTMDLRPALAKVNCPVLVLGGETDPMCPPVLMRELVDALPAGLAELHLFQGCGHGAFRDDPARVFPVIRSFVQRNS